MADQNIYQETLDEILAAMGIQFPNEFLKEYEIVSLIEKGAFGVVIKVLNRKENKEYACKVIKVTNLKGVKQQGYETEINILNTLQKNDNKNICQLVDYKILSNNNNNHVESSEQLVLLILELYKYSLNKLSKIRIKQKLVFTGLEIIDIMEKCMTALSDMKKIQIYHRDIKPDNILVNIDDKLQIKDVVLTDFNISKKLEDQQKHSLVGTFIYMSPQLRKFHLSKRDNQEETKIEHDLQKSEVFSLGMTILQVAGNFDSFKLNSLNTKTGENLMHELIESLQIDHIKNMLKKMLDHDESQRLNFEQVLAEIAQVQNRIQKNLPISKICYRKDDIRDMVVTVDLLFILDITGSMDPWLTECVTAINQALQYIRQYYVKSVFRFGMVGYRDFDVADQQRFEIQNFTNLDTFAKFIKKIDCNGGGDTCEDIQGALNQALKLDWNSKYKYAILITDAPCHGKKYYDNSDQSIKDNYPNGSQEGLVIQDLIEEIGQKNIEFCVIKVQDRQATDRLQQMVDIMSSAYEKITKQPVFSEQLGSENQFSFFISTSVISSLNQNKTQENQSQNDKSLERLTEMHLLTKINETNGLFQVRFHQYSVADNKTKDTKKVLHDININTNLEDLIKQAVNNKLFQKFEFVELLTLQNNKKYPINPKDFAQKSIKEEYEKSTDKVNLSVVVYYQYNDVTQGEKLYEVSFNQYCAKDKYIKTPDKIISNIPLTITLEALIKKAVEKQLFQNFDCVQLVSPDWDDCCRIPKKDLGKKILKEQFEALIDPKKNQIIVLYQ